MILAAVVSKNGIPIRLTEERWNHIITSHLEIDPRDFKKVMNVIKNPEFILHGDLGELLAVKRKAGTKSYLVVPYKELSESDGFILTAYLTTDIRWLLQREIIWSKE